MAGIDMGLGRLRDSSLIFKRKFRWTLTLRPYCQNGGTIPEVFIKTAKRPNIEIGETQIDFLNGRMFIPGKATWNEMEVTLMDISDSSGNLQNSSVYNWLATVYSFYDPDSLWMSGRVGGPTTTGYGCQANIYTYDGSGNALEEWILEQAWPKNIDFGELSYESEDTLDITLTLRYATAKYQSYCPQFTPKGCYDGCDGTPLPAVSNIMIPPALA